MQLTTTRRWAEMDPFDDRWMLRILDYTAYVRHDGAVYRWTASVRGKRIGLGHERTEAAAKVVTELTIDQHWNSGGDA